MSHWWWALRTPALAGLARVAAREYPGGCVSAVLFGLVGGGVLLYAWRSGQFWEFAGALAIILLLAAAIQAGRR